MPTAQNSVNEDSQQTAEDPKATRVTGTVIHATEDGVKVFKNYTPMQETSMFILAEDMLSDQWDAGRKIAHLGDLYIFRTSDSVRLIRRDLENKSTITLGYILASAVADEEGAVEFALSVCTPPYLKADLGVDRDTLKWVVAKLQKAARDESPVISMVKNTTARVTQSAKSHTGLWVAGGVVMAAIIGGAVAFLNTNSSDIE